METIDFRHVVNQLVRRFWIIVLAALLGTVLSAVFFYFTVQREPATTKITETPVAYFVLAMKEDAREDFLSGNILDYTISVTNYYVGFLNSEYNRHIMHQTILEEFPELDDEIYTYKKFNSQLSIRAESVSIIAEVKVWDLEKEDDDIFAKMDDQTKKEFAARLQDSIYSLAVSTIRNAKGLGLADFYISDYEMDTDTSKKEIEGDSFPVKKCLVIGILFGGAAAGLIVLLALLNTSVKDERDLREKTDLSVLAILHRNGWKKKSDVTQIEQAMARPEYQNAYAFLSAKIAVHSQKAASRLYILMGTEAAAGEPVDAVVQGLAKDLRESGHKVTVCSAQEALSENCDEGIVICASKSALESPEGIRLAGKGNLVLVLRQYRTKYKKLSELAAALRQVEASVTGAVLTDYFKEKWAL